MIDTVGFKIPVTRTVFNLIKNRATQFKKKDMQSGFVDYVFYRVEKRLGSYNRHVNFFLKDRYHKYIKVELSLPKYLYGTNVVLISFDDYNKALALLYADFTSFFGDFTPLNKWEVVRADICYAWKFETLQDTIKVLDVLRRYKNPRQEKTDYCTSIHSKGTWYSLKFYIKGAEFKAHDRDDMRRFGDFNLAQFLADYSASVLRFEVSLRKNALLYHKERQHIYIKDLTKRFVYGRLRWYFKKYLKGMDTRLVNTQQVMVKLREKYGKTKASHLLSFYLLSNSSDRTAFNHFCTSKSARSVRRLFYDLHRAGVGLPILDITKDYNLSIPSPIQVISGDFLPARAGKKSASTSDIVTPVEAVIFDQNSHAN